MHKIDIYNTSTPTDKGSLGYYSLIDWWNNEFNLQQQRYIQGKYKPMGRGSELTSGKIYGSSATAINFLIGLQSWFTTLTDEVISEIILKKAEMLINDETPILDIHFLYSCSIEHYYRKRNIDLRFYELVKQYCSKQILINQKVKDAFLLESGVTILPRHKGYEQLAIILEKEKNYKEALKICNEAKKVGWDSDWDKRMSTLHKKQLKVKKTAANAGFASGGRNCELCASNEL